MDIADARRLFAAGVLVTLAYWPTWTTFPSAWSETGREHGFVVAALTGWLIWRDRHRIRELAGRGLPDLVPVVALLSLAWMLATVMGIGVVGELLFTAVITAGALSVFGWSARRPILSIGITFTLATTVWGVLVPVLQRATTVASGAATLLAGIEAEVGYDTIRISAGTFLVEEGCAGINYLMGGLVLGAAYAHLYVPRWRTQLKIVGLAGAAAIVGNWIRVTALIFLGEATAMQSPYIEDHLWQGWLIFTLLMIPTYLIARRIERRDAARFPSEWAAEPYVVVPAAAAHEDGETDHEPGEAVAADAVTPDRPTMVWRAGLAALVGPVVLLAVGLVPRGTLERGTSVFGVADGHVPGVVEAVAFQPAFLGADETRTWSFSEGGRTIEAARHIYSTQRRGEELIQFGNAIAPDSLLASERVVGPVDGRGRFVNEALVRSGEHGTIVWYWYRVAGFDTPFRSKAKLLEMIAFFRRSPAAELITVAAPCDPEGCRAAAGALRSLTGAPPLPEAPAPDPAGSGPVAADSATSAADSATGPADSATSTADVPRGSTMAAGLFAGLVAVAAGRRARSIPPDANPSAHVAP